MGKTRIAKPKEFRLPNMDGFTEKDLTRNYRPTRYGSRDLEVARQCLESGNLTHLFWIVGATHSKLQEVLKNGTFEKLRYEFNCQQLCK